ncbi:hypothetical protein FCM35_KLT16591 [Carex littledalei]|uniref:Uncharacterized protein n=1 Tax=Carex littledalei TaxID=544730 RepID=A0A833VRS0_9POAL|nr:hypothetical protein FCM35_KLT16591 [Carex littledalei]
MKFWYGYVAPDDVAVLLDQHIEKGEVVDHLWRGQLGLSEEDQKNALELKRQLANLTQQNSGGCCQGSNECQFTLEVYQGLNNALNLPPRNWSEVLKETSTGVDSRYEGRN